MNIFKLGLLGALAFVIVGCDLVTGPENLNLETDFETVNVNDTFSIKLPKYLEKTDDLNGDADLQFKNELKESYIVIIGESKQSYEFLASLLDSNSSSKTTLESYKDVQLNGLKENIELSNDGEVKQLTINGLNAYQAELEGTVEGVSIPLYYIITFIESENNLYMSMQWTLNSRKEKYRNTFLQSINSFTSLE